MYVSLQTHVSDLVLFICMILQNFDHPFGPSMIQTHKSFSHDSLLSHILKGLDILNRCMQDSGPREPGLDTLALKHIETN